MNFLQRIPVTTNFVDRSAEASLIVAQGPCGSSNRTSNIRTSFDSSNNSAVMNINGQGLGCVNRFFGFDTNNTRGFCGAAGFFFYTIAQPEVADGRSCAISATAMLSGMTHHLVLPTTNEGNIFLSEDDKEVFSRCSIDCHFEVFDGEESILSTRERILEQSFSGATDAQDATNDFRVFNREVPIPTFLSFTPSGNNDVVVKLTLVFAGMGKGMFNGCSVGQTVPFDPPHTPNGFFSTRIDFAVTKSIDYAKLFDLGGDRYPWLDDIRIRMPIS